MKNSAAFLPKPDFSITILSQTQLLKMVVELTRHIATLFQFPLKEAQKISLAIDEAVTNVIKHSYANQAGPARSASSISWPLPACASASSTAACRPTSPKRR